MKYALGSMITIALLALLLGLNETAKSRKITACEGRNGIPLFTRSGNYKACAAALITWGE